MSTLIERLGISIPLIQSPMAGGLSTPALVAAVANAGGLGSIGAAYMSSAQLEQEVAEIRKRTAGPFAINLFAGGEQPADPLRAALVTPALKAFRRELGISEEPPAPAPRAHDDRFERVLKLQPRAFSFTFGIPPPEQLRALRAQSILIIGTATNLPEAQALEEAQVDAICAQGAEAGGHRGTFIGPVESGLVPTAELVPLLIRGVHTPIIAAGGLMDGQAISRALSWGAAAVQLGTAFLNCAEAGTPPAYRNALTAGPGRETVITRAYSGRYARAIRNRFTDAFAQKEVAPYPQQQQLTQEIRSAATRQSRADLMQMLVGEGAPRVRALSAAELIAILMSEMHP